ncbi:hypothetical protein RUM43_009145 [Polyplax serrata]|uniref:Angio-associated migratory cell protein n=1 Tax=Polyplax serrata TaxID=468196 RepID=A0AAN8PAC8_POLSC
MPAQETPPSSPSIHSDLNDNNDEDEEMAPFLEEDMIEILDETDISRPMESDEEDEDEGEGEAAGSVETIPERDDSQLVFKEHSKDVLTCDFHPSKNTIVASGGMDDTVYIWDTTNGNKLFTCKGHEESVEIVSFSFDGSYLATADLNGVIKVWRIRDYNLILTFELEDELGWLQWHMGTNVLVASSQNGMVYMYKVPSGDTKVVIPEFGQNCLAGKILPDGKSLACGYSNGCLKIVDLRQGTTLKDVKPVDEIGGITCLDVHKSNNLIICGSTSGAVILINSNNGKVVSVLQGVQSPDSKSYIEAVSFCKDPSHQVAASGSLDGNLIIWDIVKQSLRHKHNFSSCINHLAWHPSLPLIFTCHFEGIVRAFDAKAGEVKREFLGHQKSCLNMGLSRDGSLLMTASEDNTVRIFSVGDIM